MRTVVLDKILLELLDVTNNLLGFVIENLEHLLTLPLKDRKEVFVHRLHLFTMRPNLRILYHVVRYVV